jgi:starvation-inducible outer membrane lipoprotein
MKDSAMTRSKVLGRLILLSLIGFGCAAAPVFPPDVVDHIDRTLTFAALKENPTAFQGTTVQLGGQIVGSRSNQDVRILVRELPIRTHPVYGPVDTGHFRGMFVVLYPGKVTDQDLQHGNMVVVVGTVIGAVPDTLTRSPVMRPTVRAQCLHVWRTGGAAIDDFPWPPFLQGYWPLVEQTYCADRRNVLLNIS